MDRTLAHTHDSPNPARSPAAPECVPLLLDLVSNHEKEDHSSRQHESGLLTPVLILTHI
jgi:hypothetical protein